MSFTLTAAAAAQPHLTLPPWGPGIPAFAQSVQILKGDQPLFDRPGGEAQRRGSAFREARLPLFGARAGPDCGGLWLHVGPLAWVCQDAVALSGATPVSADRINIPSAPDGLPFRYHFVGPDGSFGYDRPEQVDIGEPATSLEPGFAVALVETRTAFGQPIGRTTRDLWVPLRDLAPARPLAFEGETIDELVESVGVPLAWVIRDLAPLYSRSGGSMFVPNGRTRARFQRVGFLETAAGFARTNDNDWVRIADVRHPTVAPPPPEIAVDERERWIDIELSSQTLVAYEGDRPLFTTLVSTGRGRQGSAEATPKGVHRVWVKLLTSVMDNLENEHASRYWRMEDVPYVQYFSNGVGLHAAFWHRSFGFVRSHGCVNLAPLDAKRLFGWTGPGLPAGWTAALPTKLDRGTLIRVR